MATKKKSVTRDSIIAKLKKWQRIFCLMDWQLHIEWEKEQPDDANDLIMRITWPENYRSAQVQVFPAAFERSPFTVDQSCCHEMLHLPLAPVDDELARLIGKGSEVWKAYGRCKETAIDRLAIALSNHIRGT